MDFYTVDENYISYLQNYEKKYRDGITRVPNVKYENRCKFSFGAVLTINDISYYVAALRGGSFLFQYNRNLQSITS